MYVYTEKKCSVIPFMSYMYSQLLCVSHIFHHTLLSSHCFSPPSHHYAHANISAHDKQANMFAAHLELFNVISILHQHHICNIIIVYSTTTTNFPDLKRTKTSLFLCMTFVCIQTPQTLYVCVCWSFGAMYFIITTHICTRHSSTVCVVK